MFDFILYVVENVNDDEVREKGWWGILEDFNNSVGNIEDFDRMVRDLKKFMIEKFD